MSNILLRLIHEYRKSICGIMNVYHDIWVNKYYHTQKAYHIMCRK